MPRAWDRLMQTRRVLGGRYRLISRLGHGGMSVVWRARDIVLDRDVAVKVLAGDRDQPIRDAVRTEALAAAKLAHPHIAQVFDYGEEYHDSAPVQFVVMELLHGRSLADVDLPLAPPSALRICAEVAAALASAHAQGVVHRDVKPGNVMVTPDGAKVFDFGLAARVGAPELDDRNDRIFGTPAYVAPERLTGAAVGTAADVYALGVLLYKTLTGEPPWAATTPAALIAAHANEEPALLPELDGVPASVGELYRRCLSRDPDDRPPASVVAGILATIVKGQESDLQVRAATPVGGPDELGTAPIGTPLRSHIRRQRATVAMLAAGAVVALGAVAAFIAVSLRPGLPGTPDDRAAAAPPRTVIVTITVTGPDGSVIVTPVVTITTDGGDPFPVVFPPTDPGVPTTAIQTTPAHTTGQPPTTTGPPPPTTIPPTTTAGARTFISDAGRIVADCHDTLAHLLSWTPAPGYQAIKPKPGPAPEASITFVAGTGQLVMAVTCPSGVPTVSIRDGRIPHPTGP